MAEQRRDGDNTSEKEISRRDFFKITGVVIAGVGTGFGFLGCAESDDEYSLLSIPLSQGYLVVDNSKCQGCVTCMLTCSLVHEGIVSLSRARIQIVQNSFERWPDDIVISQCRQCKSPECVIACPRRALHADFTHGNVRLVDRSKCIGCGKCVKACPYLPKRPIIFEDQDHNNFVKSRKCDLCIDTPHLVNENGERVQGGPGGMQACVQVCPVGAIKFTPTMPEQAGNGGYVVNLKDEAWASLGYPLKVEEDPDAGQR